MKEEALHEGANVNLDETWCRYQSCFGHKKHYMWCLANKVEKGDLMLKAVNYMHAFWNQLIRNRSDGNYIIDNLLPERCIRPMTVECKNSLFFCSKAGAKASAIFHTIIETCK